MKSVDFTCINQLMELLKIPAVEKEIKDLVIQDKLQIVDSNDNIILEKELKEGFGINLKATATKQTRI